MNTESSKINKSNKFFMNLLAILVLKNIALANLSIYYASKNIKSAYNNNKFKLSAPTWNDLPHGSYSISDTQYYFEFIIKKHETIADNSPVQIYICRIKNRNDFKKGYKLELFSWNNEIIRKRKKDVNQNEDG